MPETKSPTVAFYTLGCRLNQYETEAIREQFEARGYRVVPYDARADVYVVNTCTVTARADYRARQTLRRAIRRAPDATVVATGCYAQTSPHKLLGIDGVDLVLGNAEKGRLADYIREADGQRAPQAHVTRRAAIKTFDERLDTHSFEGRTRAAIKIQDGCDQFCSFCIIPWARGRHRSRPLEHIVRQTCDLVDAGYQEVVLTGVHLAEYGSDFPHKPALTDVVRALLERTRVPRVRMSSIWPTGVTGEMIRLLSEYAPRFCRHFHLAIQHGHNDVLKRMRRTYTIEDTRRMLDRLVETVPEIGIGSDILVGFPGETDAQFEAMHRWLESSPLTYLHVFSYSKREKTRAASFPDQVPPEAAQERSERLRALSAAMARRFHALFIGREVDVLVENRDATGRLTGLTDHYVRVSLPGDDALINTRVRVVVDEADEAGARGIPVDAIGRRICGEID